MQKLLSFIDLSQMQNLPVTIRSCFDNDPRFQIFNYVHSLGTWVKVTLSVNWTDCSAILSSIKWLILQIIKIKLSKFTLYIYVIISPVSSQGAEAAVCGYWLVKLLLI